MLSIVASFSRTPGMGQFTCCQRQHKMPSAPGQEPMTIPCDRVAIGAIMLQMLDKKIEYEADAGDRDKSRVWRALTPHFMHGLSSDAIRPAPEKVLEFLAAFGLDKQASWHDPQAATPLMLAALSGNAAVVPWYSSLKWQREHEMWYDHMKSFFADLRVFEAIPGSGHWLQLEQAELVTSKPVLSLNIAVKTC